MLTEEQRDVILKRSNAAEKRRESIRRKNQWNDVTPVTEKDFIPNVFADIRNLIRDIETLEARTNAD